MGRREPMTRRVLALLLVALAAMVYATLVLPAQQARGAAEAEYARARVDRQRLKVRLASLDRRMREEQGATAADGATAVQALRRASLQATEGLPVSAVEVSTRLETRGMVAARARILAEGRFVDALRFTRRLAAPSSGLLLQSVKLAETGDRVRVEASVFILRESS
jgi:hypothetical protein